MQGNDRFALQDIELNTGQPEEQGEFDGSYRSLVKNVKPGEEVVLALSPAQVFERTVRYADSGEVAPHAGVWPDECWYFWPSPWQAARRRNYSEPSSSCSPGGGILRPMWPPHCPSPLL